MHGLEALFFALVVLFYIVRAIVRGVRRVIAAARRAIALPPEQTRPPLPSQTRPQRQAATNVQGRRPEAGSPITANAPLSVPSPGGVVESTRAAEPPPATPAARREQGQAPRLWNTNADIVRAVILQEVLAKPLSQRPRRQGYRDRSVHPPQ